MDEHDEMALTAVKLYFRKGLSQAGVAKELGVSRPTASKLIALGKERGYVTIEIHDPREENSRLITQLQEKFGLESVHIAYPPRNTRDDLLHELGSTGAHVLHHLVKDGMSIGVSWGETLYSVAQYLHHTAAHDVHIVQLKGGHSHSARSTHDMATLTRFAHAFNAEASTLPVPIIFESKRIAQAVKEDRVIASVLEAGRNTDLAVFTVGDASPQSLPLNLGYLTDEEMEKLEKKAVGDACSRFFTATGTIAVPEIDARTIGISLYDLASRPYRLLIAGGANKLRALHVALKMGLATHLVTDQHTALQLLSKLPENTH